LNALFQIIGPNLIDEQLKSVIKMNKKFSSREGIRRAMSNLLALLEFGWWVLLPVSLKLCPNLWVVQMLKIVVQIGA